MQTQKHHSPLYAFPQSLVPSTFRIRPPHNCWHSGEHRSWACHHIRFCHVLKNFPLLRSSVFLRNVKIIKCKNCSSKGTVGGYLFYLTAISSVSVCKDLLRSAKHMELVGFPFLHLTPGIMPLQPLASENNHAQLAGSLPLRFLPLQSANGKGL